MLYNDHDISRCLVSYFDGHITFIHIILLLLDPL
uniref:Uncharacterized protein n=1 Tax=Arundo donax TaxID=35708 RepID=A0A0A9AJE1_ARUDO